MHVSTKVLRFAAYALALAGVVLMLMPAQPSEAGGKDPKKKDLKKDDKKDPKKDDKKLDEMQKAERIKSYMKQLHARFDAWDANNDKTLDAKELAKVFRGPKADPLDKLKIKLPTPDAPPMPVPVVEMVPGKVRPISLALLTFPGHVLPVNGVAADLLADKPKEVVKYIVSPPKTVVAPKTPEFWMFGDYVFLTHVGKGSKDWKVSTAEFEGFAKNYANVLAQLEEAVEDLAHAKSRLAKAGTPKAKLEAQKELAQANTAMKQAQAQWHAIPTVVHEALKIKH